MQDRRLVDACVAGSRGAWQLLYEQQHPRLLRSIAGMLGPIQGHDFELTEEIAARVWFAIVSNECDLLRRFDESRGCRLATYLAAIAKDQMVRFFRSKKRRQRREAESLRGKPVAARFDHPVISLQDFATTLTPSEREFFEHVLTNGGSTADCKEYTDANRWQLTSRIRSKLRERLGM